MTGEDLRRWRKRAGLTQAELGARLELSRKTIERYENDQAPISRRLELIVRAYPAGVPEE